MNPTATYLSKDGKTFGPFTDQELLGIQSCGELQSYQWIWKTGDAGWKRLDLVPPPPPVEMPRAFAPVAPSTVSDPVVAAPAMAVVNPAPPSVVRIEVPKTLEVLCYDHVHLQNGEITEMDNRGAIFVVRNRETSPRFVKNTRIKLNLLDTLTGEATERSAALSRVTRREGSWEYELRWVQPASA
jgi:hypothetical protein